MISIITPILNGVQFIRDNIESIQKLTIPYEHIIIDGGSTDGTLKILEEYSSVKIIHQQEKTGMYGAIDLGFSVAKGEYICWINCDDRIISDGFEKIYKHAICKNLDFLCSDGIFYYTESNKKILVKGTRFAKYFLRKGFFPFSQPSVIYKKSLYIDVQGLNFEKYKITGDGDLFHRMSMLNYARFGYLPIKTSVFLKHGNSLGDNNSQLALEELKKNISRPKCTFYNRILLRILRIINI